AKRNRKEKEIDVLTKETSESLWLRDLNALDHQLLLDGNYPRMEENNFQSSQDDGKSSPEIAEEAPKKKARAKGAATSPLPLCPTKKRLKR
nr:hypothetical protein [Tanacetum cinerariifolium]